MELRLLGPVELWSDGRKLDAGPAKQRCVLAVLGLSAGTPVSPETLIDRVWGDGQPDGVRGALYTYVARLRRILGVSAALRRDAAGYLLEIRRDQVDAHRFRAATERARRAATSQGKAEQLREALKLWRGAPLSGVTGDWADSVRANLEQLRLNALTERIDLDLRNHQVTAELVDELTDLVAVNPTAERFTGQLMVSLYLTGRTGEALAAFERLRRHLADELGHDPGPELRRLHQQILRRDPALRTEYTASAAPRPEVPRQMPTAPAAFVGRETELRTVTRALAARDPYRPSLVAIYGPGGVGKSSLALRAAHAHAADYPDGQLYIDLQGSSPGVSPLSPVEALGRFLRALGLAAAAIPVETEEAAARFRSLLADRRILLVLDNAADTAQVRPLLPGNAGSAALVTGRAMLSGLDGARHVGLGVLAPTESVDLLVRLDPTGRAAADPDRVAELAELCGHLPLALRITAARITSRPDWPLGSFVERLADEQHRLDHLGHKDLSVRSCFQASYQALVHGDPTDRAAAHAFRLLGLPDGPDVSLPVAARLLDRPEPEADAVLDRLVDAQLLDSPVPGRYRIHDLLRLYARELAQQELPEPARYAALARTWRCYVATTAHAAQLHRPGRRKDLVTIDPDEVLPLADHREATAWLEAESANLLAAARQAASAPGDLPINTVQLAHALFVFMHVNAHWTELREINLSALDLARARNDRPAEAQILSDLGVLAWRTGDGDDAVKVFEQSLAVRREVGDRIGIAFTLFNLGVVHDERGTCTEALTSLEEALTISREVGYRSGEAIALQVLGEVNCKLGHLDVSTKQIRRSLAIYRELGDSLGEAHALRSLGCTLVEHRSLAEAISCFEQALSINRERSSIVEAANNLVHLASAYLATGEVRRSLASGEEALGVSRQVGALHEQGQALWVIGRVWAELGDPARADEHWREALPILERLGAPEAADVRRLRAELPTVER